MREQADRLDRVADVAAQLLGLERAGVGAVDEDAAARRLDEAVDHAQRRGLAAARRADEHGHLAVGDLEGQVVDGEPVAVALRDMFEA